MTAFKPVGKEVSRYLVDRAEPRGAGGAESREGFSSAVDEALEALDQTMVQADHQAARLAVGEGNLHETAIAIEKADVAMRLAVRIRNKIVDAYQEIMRMPV
ncbi:MAG: flagellar hook-basal body complex protein FliE [Deltaproteobacteria bacterium]|nr:MAG: flagellar hook-basal body complex protein FliE [Deltaproteobacteria bacterium]